MKKTIIAFSIVLICSSVFGQRTNQEDRTVFGGSRSFGGFLGFSAKAGDINGQASLMAGMELAAVFSSSFNVGFVGYGLTTNVDADTYDDEGKLYEIHFGYGGLLLEPVIASRSMVHVTFPLVLGVGGAGTHKRFNRPLKSEDFEDFEKKYDAETDVVLVVEPGLSIEINLLRNVRLDMGASYRYVYDSNIPEIEDKELSGISGNVSLKFGWF